MSQPTAFLARLIGLYCLIAALLMGAQREAFVAAVDGLVRSAPLLLLLGAVVMLAGLALVLAHNVWSGGALPVLVTVIGWATLLKGLSFWLLPPAAAAQLYLAHMHYGELYYVYCALSFALGLYLTIAGFRSRPRP